MKPVTYRGNRVSSATPVDPATWERVKEVADELGCCGREYIVRSLHDGDTEPVTFQSICLRAADHVNAPALVDRYCGPVVAAMRMGVVIGPLETTPETPGLEIGL